MIIEASENPPAPAIRVGIDADRSLLQRSLVALALALMLVSIWALMHRYRGLTGDAELYAMQALARLQPGLQNDLYLAGGSQDRFTIFSPIYATFIRILGLRNAAVTLTALCTVWFLGAAWFLARKLSTRSIAWLSVSALIIIFGRYGAYGVFRYLEEWVTARSVAEALIVSGLACHFYGRRTLGLGLGLVATTMHPLMAFPGLLLLLSLSLPGWVVGAGAVAGILAALALSFAPAVFPATGRWITIMDPAWLEVVRERSQFLFLQLWTLADWKLNARGFLSLVFTAMVITDPRARRLCVCAMVIGAAGLLVGLIASTLGPVAILMQGQAWRWVWLTMFLAILLLPQTVREVWKDPSCGPLCAVLLVGSWTFTPIDPVTGTAVALFLWTVRGHLSDQMGRLLRWAAYAAAAVALAWVVANAWTITAAPSPETGREGALFSHLRNILGLDITAVPIVGLVWFALLRVRSAWVSTAVAAAFAGLAVTALPGAFLQFGLVGAQRQIDEFADWRRLIPPASNVFVIPEHNAATFAWFDLQRPSYISVDQSSGVVFSRSISMEVKRRSEVVLPILDPGWRILSHLEAKHLGKADGDTIRPLTGAKLMAICSDPILDFVVAREDVGFDSQRHVQPGPWKDWHLYDCRRLREGARPA